MTETTTTAEAEAETAIRAMEKPSQEQIQQQQQPLKCPRCESTNTKFCYYNNYSLSQPRHFCKACKRYWTRGGTLRNVPVGGGCRKNKRVRRPNSNNSSNSSATSNNSSSINEPNTFTSQSLNPNGGGAHLVNPMLYGLPTNLHLPHPSSHEFISNGFQFSGFENHHQQNQFGGLGLGFSSNGILGGNGFSTPKQILQDLISNSNPSLLPTTTTTCTTTLPTMSLSSLLTSRLQQQKFNFHNSPLMPYQSDQQMKEVGNHENEGAYNMKNDHVKSEDEGARNQHREIESRYEIHDHHQQSSMEASDPSILWNNSNNNGTGIGGNWLDPNFSSIGSSSVPSLI